MNDTITVIGGDARFLHTKSYLDKKGYNVNSVFLASGENSLEAAGKTVILPLPAFHLGKLNAPFADKTVSMDELLEAFAPGTEVFGGMLPKNFILKANEKRVKTVDYYEDETLLTENAFLTAKGLKKLLKENGVGVEYEKVLVLGFGRCGKAISSVLSFSGAEITAVSGKAASICEYNAIPFEKLGEKISDYPLIINTVPSLILKEKEIKKIRKNSVIVEIASAPFGVDFAAAEKHGIKILKAVSLPGKYFPKEAGEVIAKIILREGG